MIYAIAYFFIVATWLNRKDRIKYAVASSFAVIQLLNVFETFDGLDYYKTNIAANAILILLTLSLSRRNWSLNLSLVLLVSTLLNVIGMINMGTLRSERLLDLIYYSSYLTTFAELAVLVLMINGMDGYLADSSRLRGWKHSLRNLFAVSHHQLHQGKA